VGGFLGYKGQSPDDWLTGYAREPEKVEQKLPAGLETDLQTGLALKLVGQEAYDFLTA
jgi:hypothetical protein